LILRDKNNQQYEKTLIFKLLPFPLAPKEDKLKQLTRLTMDRKHNWRLEI